MDNASKSCEAVIELVTFVLMIEYLAYWFDDEDQ